MCRWNFALTLETCASWRSNFLRHRHLSRLTSGIMFLTGPFDSYVTKLVNIVFWVFWRWTNRFWHKLAKEVLGRGHQTINSGGQEVEGQGHKRSMLWFRGPAEGTIPLGRAAFLVLANSEMVKFPPVVDLTPNALTEHTWHRMPWPNTSQPSQSTFCHTEWFHLPEQQIQAISNTYIMTKSYTTLTIYTKLRSTTAR